MFSRCRCWYKRGDCEADKEGDKSAECHSMTPPFSVSDCTGHCAATDFPARAVLTMQLRSVGETH